MAWRGKSEFCKALISSFFNTSKPTSPEVRGLEIIGDGAGYRGGFNELRPGGWWLFSSDVRGQVFKFYQYAQKFPGLEGWNVFRHEPP